MSLFRTRLPVDPFGWSVPDVLPPAHPKVILVIGEPSEHALFPLLSSRHLCTSLVLIATHAPPIIPGDHAPTVRVLRLIDPLVADASALRLMNLFERAQAIASTPSNNQRFLHFSESYSGGDFLISPTSPHANDVNRLFASSQLSLPTKSSRKQPVVRERVTFDAIINFLSPNVSEKVLLRHAILVTTLGAQYLAPSSASLSPTYFPLLATPVVKRSRFSFLTSPSAVTLPDQKSTKPKKRFSLFRFSSSSTVQVTATNLAYDNDNDDPSSAAASATRVATLWTSPSHHHTYSHPHPHPPTTTGNPTSIATTTSSSTFRIHLVHVLPDGWIPESSASVPASRYRTYSGPSHSHSHSHSHSYSSSTASTPDSSRYPSRASSPLATRSTTPGTSPPPVLNAYAYNRLSTQQQPPTLVQSQSLSLRTRRASLTQRHVRAGSGGSTLGSVAIPKPKLAQSIEQFVLSFVSPAGSDTKAGGGGGGYYGNETKKRPMSAHALSSPSILGSVQEETNLKGGEKDVKRPGTASSIAGSTISRNLGGKGGGKTLPGEDRQKPIPYVVGPGVWSAYIPGTSSRVSPGGGGVPLMHVRELTVGEMIVLGGVDDEGSGLSVPPGRAWIGSVDELVVVRQQQQWYQRPVGAQVDEVGAMEREVKEVKEKLAPASIHALAPASAPTPTPTPTVTLPATKPKPETDPEKELMEAALVPKQHFDPTPVKKEKEPLESLPTPPQSSSSSEGGDDDDVREESLSGHAQDPPTQTPITVPVAPSVPEPTIPSQMQSQAQHPASRPESFTVTPSPVDSFPSLMAVSEGSSSSSSSSATPLSTSSTSGSRAGSMRTSDSSAHISVSASASDLLMMSVEEKPEGIEVEKPRAAVVRARPVVDDVGVVLPVSVPLPAPAPVPVSIPVSPVDAPVVSLPIPASTSVPVPVPAPVRVPTSARIPAPDYTAITSTTTPRKTVSDAGHGTAGWPVSSSTRQAKHTRSGSDPSSNSINGSGVIPGVVPASETTPTRKPSTKRRESLIRRISRSVSGGKDKEKDQEAENVKPQYHYKKASEYREEERRKEREEEARREREREREKEVIRAKELEKGRSEKEWGVSPLQSQAGADPQSRSHPQMERTVPKPAAYPSHPHPHSPPHPHPHRPAPPPPASSSSSRPRPPPPVVRSPPHAHHHRLPSTSSSTSPSPSRSRRAPPPAETPITSTEYYSRYPMPGLMRSASSGSRSLSPSGSGPGAELRGRGRERVRDSEELWGGGGAGGVDVDAEDLDRLRDERRLYAEFHPPPTTMAVHSAVKPGVSMVTRKGSVGSGSGVGRKLVKKGSLSGAGAGRGEATVPVQAQPVRVVA